MLQPDEFDDLVFDFTPEELDQLEARLREPGPSNITAYTIPRTATRTPTPSLAAPALSPTILPAQQSRHSSPSFRSSLSQYVDDELFDDQQFLDALDRELTQAERRYADGTPHESTPASGLSGERAPLPNDVSGEGSIISLPINKCRSTCLKHANKGQVWALTGGTTNDDGNSKGRKVEPLKSQRSIGPGEPFGRVY